MDKTKLNEINKEKQRTILKFEQKIIEYHQNLNSAGIWLFVATLGCWSVNDDGYFRIAAVLITFFLFTHQLISKLPSYKLFKTELKEIESQIDETPLPRDSKDARKRKLEQVEKQHLGWFRIVKSLPAYYLSIFFICFSMAHWADLI